MKKIFKLFLVPAVSVLFLNACATTEQEMQEFDPQANVCEPIEQIVNITTTKSINRLVIDVRDSNGNVIDRVGVVSWIVKEVTEVIKDASLKIYLKIAINLDFRFLVAMMMTMAVILFAASVLLGMTQANGYNALMFVIKLVVIYQLTINYFYFYTYVIQTFEAVVTDTMMFSSLTFSDFIAVDPTIICLGLFGQACDIASILGTLFFGNSTAISDAVTGWFGGNPSNNPVRKLFLFNSFDDTISFFFDVRQWKLVLALATTGMTGIFWAGMIFLMQMLYLFAVINAVKVYLLSYIARWALYGLGPIFISFALFRQTKSLFDGWLQQLISFTLQPVLLFIFMGMFQSMIQGFISQIYIDVGNSGNNYKIYVPCDNTIPGNTCTKIECAPNDAGCVADGASSTGWAKYVTEKDATAQAMCVKWSQLPSAGTGGEPLYWYRLCQQVAVGDPCLNSGIKPMIPIDIWMVMAVIVMCYLMYAMCAWVTEVANSLAGGAMSLSGVKVMGWDTLKSGVSRGAGGLWREMSSGGGRGGVTK